MRRLSSRSKRWAGPAAVLGALSLLLAACSAENNGQNSLKPRGPQAEKIDNLFIPVFWISVVIGVLVLGAVVVFALHYRYRSGRYEYPKQKVVTANELIIPAGRPVKVDLRACDESLPNKCNVIHSFWVPELNGKRDVVPGHNNFTTIEANKPGTYLGQCAEYCGLSHANMRFRVIAKEPREFDRWIGEQQQGPAVPFQIGTGAQQQPAGPAQELMSTKFQCTNCHSVGDSKVSSYGPNLTHLASRTTFASGYYELARDKLVQWVHNAPS